LAAILLRPHSLQHSHPLSSNTQHKPDNPVFSPFASPPSLSLQLTLGVSYFATNEVDPTIPIMGIEPVYVYAAATLFSAVGGYLVGPWLGLSAWRIWNRKISGALEVKEKVFYQRIGSFFLLVIPVSGFGRDHQEKKREEKTDDSTLIRSNRL
jgi:hypothetical protein